MFNKIERLIGFAYIKKAFSLLFPVLILALFSIGFIFLSIQTVSAAPGIRQTINFQGKLVNSSGLNVSNSTYTVVFTLYDAPSGGSQLWQETRSVTTVDGIFREELGSDTSLSSVDFNNDSIYLGIKVGSDAEMSPRVRFTATPYAFQAKQVAWSGLQDAAANLAVSMGSYTSAFTYGNSTGANDLFKLADTSSNSGTGKLLSIQTASGSSVKPFHVSSAGVEAILVDASGNIGIGTTNPSRKLDINGTVRMRGQLYDYNDSVGTPGQVLSTTATGVEWIDASGVGTDDQTLAEVYAEAGNSVQLTAGSGDIRFYRGTNTEMLFLDESSGNVGVGTTNPSIGKLQVSGNIYSAGTMQVVNSSNNGLTNRGFVLSPADYNGESTFTAWGNSGGTTVFGARNTGSGNITAQLSFEPGAGIVRISTGTTSPSERMRINASGDVGIGTTNPGYKLDVNGDIRIANGSELYSYGSATLGDRSYTTPSYVTSGQTFTASIQALDDAVEGIVVGSGGVWGRDSVNGYLYPNEITDRVGIGTSSPSEMLHVVGNILASGNITAGGIITGTGSGLTDLNASNLASGTVPSARITGNYSGITGVGTITSGTWQGSVINATYLDPAVILATEIDTSAELAGIVTDETGSGALVFANSPTFAGNVLFPGSGTWESTGDVGIGTTNPGYKLDVNGDVQIANGSELYSYGSATLGDRSYTTPSYVTSGQTFTASIQALDDAVEGIVVGSGGVWSRDSVNGYLYPQTLTDSVGIGTSSPTEKLHVVGNILATGNITAGGIITGTGSGLTDLNASNLASGTVPSARITGNYSGITGVGTITSGTWQGSVIDATYLDSEVILSSEIDTSAELAAIIGDETGTGSLVFADSPTFAGNVLFPGSGVWNSSGNVGIGTTNPGSYKLNVAGQGYFTGTTANIILNTNASSSADELTIQDTSANFLLDAEGASYRFRIYAGQNATDSFGIKQTDGNSRQILKYNNSANELFLLEGGGNVGIGTTNPGYRLDVNGDVQIANGSELYSYGSATLGNRTYTEDNYVTDGETFTASIDALDQQLADVIGGAGGVWSRDAGNGYLYPATITDRVGIGTSSPSEMLHVVGNILTSGNITAGGIITGTGSGLTDLNASNLASGTVPSARISGNYSGITGVGTITSGTWQGSVINSTYLDPAVILSTEIDTYSELNAIVSDVTLTHNGLIDTSAEIAGIVGDETGTGALVFANSPQLVTPNIGAATGTSLNVTGAITAGGIITGTGSGLTDLNANNLTTGTVPNGRISGAYTGFTDITGSGTASFDVFRADNGSAGSPAYSFTADTDSGMYQIGADIVSLVTGGIDRLTILAGGNIGIGTTNPGAALEVAGQVKITGGSPGANKVLVSDATGLASWQTISSSTITDDSLDFDKFADSMTLDAMTKINQAGFNFNLYGTGNVGIGTTNPNAKLHVVGNIVGSTLSDGTVVITNGNISGAGTVSATTLNASGNITAGGIITGTGSGLTGLNASNLASGTVPSARISGNYSGITGVGTITSGTWQGSVINSTYLDPAVILSTEIDTSAELAAIIGDETGSGALVFANSPNLITPNIGAATGTSLNTSGDITVGGNVGIGTTNPGAALEVNGQVKITGGSPGVNKVLMSDTNGLATWQSISAATIDNDSLDFDKFKDNMTLDAMTKINQAGFDFGFYGTGNVGIGTTSPSAKLHVDGNILSTGIITGTGSGLTDLNASNLASGTVPSARITGNYSGITGVGTITSGTWQGSVISSTYLDSAVILSSEIDTYAELNAIVADVTLTHNGLIDTSAEIAGIVGDETGTGNLVFSNSPVLTTPNIGAATGTSLNVTGAITAGGVITGTGSGLTNLNASNLTTGTVPDGRISGAYTGLTNITGSGTATFGTFSADNGSATVPSFNFTSDTNTGMYRLGTDILSLVTAGVERITMLAGGNVGIGTTAPGAKLEVAGQVKITGGSPGANKVLTSDASGLATWETLTSASIGDDSLDFDKFADSMTLDAMTKINQNGFNFNLYGTGSVGIGTTNPSARLHVVGNIVGSTLSDGTISITGGNITNAGAITASGIITGTGSGLTNLNASNLASGTVPDARITGAYTGITNLSMSGTLDFGSTGGEKINLYGTTYGVGINSSELTVWKPAAANFRIRDGSGTGDTTRLELTATTHHLNIASGGLQTAGTLRLTNAGALQNITSITASGTVTAGNGTAGAPSFSFTSDTNTGMYRGGTDILGFSTAGADRLTILANGNIGIGTTNPGAKLEVAGQVKITGGSPGANKVLTSDANGLASWSSIGAVSIDDDSLDFDKFADAMTLDAMTKINQAGFNFGFYGTGNVGIGTTSPSAKLDVAGDAEINGAITNFTQMTSATNGTMPKIVLDSTNAGDNWTSQGAYISLGEGGDLGAASLHMTYRGDGYGFIGSGAVSNGEPGASYLRFDYDSNNIYTPDTLTVGSLMSNGDIRNTAANGQLGASANFVFRDTGDSWLRLRNASGSSTYADMALGNVYAAGTGTLGGISGTDQTIENNFGNYLHLGAWGVGRTATNAVLVNTAYRSDILSTARNINGVSFNGSADITVNGLNYNVNNTWLREQGDNDNFQIYGNSRQIAFRTDGTAEYSTGVGGYPFAWMYGGDASGNRRMLLSSNGRLWLSGINNWIDTYFTNASNLSSGTVANGRISGAYSGITTLSMSSTLTVGGNGTIAGALSANRIGISNTDSTLGRGISLYNGPTTGAPTYGLMFAGTGTFGTHGNVTGDWATYFTMSNTTNRGWIFRRGSTNVASIAGNGVITGNGSGLSSLNASNLASGTVSNARMSGSYSWTSLTLSNPGLALFLNNGANNSATDMQFAVNGATRWAFSTRASGENYRLAFWSNNGGSWNQRAYIDYGNGSFIAAGHLYAHNSTHVGDVAEFMPNHEVLEAGDIAAIDNTLGSVGRATKASGFSVAGIVSSNPSVFVNSPKVGVPLGLTGKIPVKVALINGEIKPGDPITISDVPGVGMKATEAGGVVAIASEELTEETFNQKHLETPEEREKAIPEAEYENGEIVRRRTIPADEATSNYFWVDEAGDRIEDINTHQGTAYKVTRIIALIKNTYHDPELQLTTAGEMIIDGEQGAYSVRNAVTGDITQKSYAANEMITAYLKAGSIETADLTVNGTAEFTSINVEDFNLAGKSLSQYIEDSVITGEVFTAIETKVDDQKTMIEQLDLESNILSTSVASQSASLQSVTARLEQIEEATNDTEAVIASLQDRISALEGLFENNMSTNSAMLFTESSTATVSANIARSITDTEVIFDKKLISEDDLTILGNLSTTDLSVTGSISSGLLTINGFNDEMATPSATISTLTGILELQHDGMNGIEFVAGKVGIDVNGNVLVREGDVDIENGNLVLRKGSIKGSSSIRGIDVQVTQGETELQVIFDDINDTAEYAISVLPSWFTNVIVEEKTIDGFKIKFANPAPADARVDWLIIE